MKMPSLLTFTLAGMCALTLSLHADSGKEVLFNGKDLTGWKGDANRWKVENGAIVGVNTAENPLKRNEFLIWQGADLEDFVLTAELKLTSEGNNSGIQYRSKVRPEVGDFVVSGYQCDMHPAVWANGMLYEEGGRGILTKRGQSTVIPDKGTPKIVKTLPVEPVFDTSEWATYRITAKGNHLIHEINGVRTVEVFDHDVEKRSLSGVLAFQIHAGAPMKIEIRNVTLQRLETSAPTAPEATPIPDGAADVNPPKRGLTW